MAAPAPSLAALPAAAPARGPTAGPCAMQGCISGGTRCNVSAGTIGTNQATRGHAPGDGRCSALCAVRGHAHARRQEPLALPAAACASACMRLVESRDLQELGGRSTGLLEPATAMQRAELLVSIPSLAVEPCTHSCTRHPGAEA